MKSRPTSCSLKRFKRTSLESSKKRNIGCVSIKSSFVVVSLLLVAALKWKTMPQSIGSLRPSIVYDNANIGSSRNADQRFVIFSGSNSAEFIKVQNDLTTWSQHYKIHPWKFAYPDVSPTMYNKTQASGPLIKSLSYLNTGVSKEKFNFNRIKKLEADHLVETFTDAFIHRWLQGGNILMGSTKLNLILDNVNGDCLLKGFLKTMPWNDPKYDLKGSVDSLEVVIIHRSNHIEHLKSIWASSKQEKSESFSHWLINEFDFDEIDSYRMALKLIRNGISVSFVKVDVLQHDDQNDLTHFIACNILNIECDGNRVIGLEESGETIELPDDLDIDLNDEMLNQVEEVIKSYEGQRSCLENDQNVNVWVYPTRRSRTTSASCHFQNEKDLSLRDEVMKVLESNI
mmetsp:Transcript_10290/g.11394  ORF Transcript_10290/g.11394 Transcript_10290/m.11394 type:complete len:400 (-) Transcript_10290:110-1309(-)